MAIAHINCEQRHEGVGMESTELPLMPVEVSKETIDDWKDSAAEYVRSELFDKKQFVTDGELMMGENIQKLVCKHINFCRNERARMFWNERGDV